MTVYISPIALGILVSLLIIYFSFIPMAIHQYRKYGTMRINTNIVVGSFVVYMITAWFMTVLPLPSMEAVLDMKPMQPNLKPFLFVSSFLNCSGFVLTKPGTWLAAMRSSSFFTVAFNVVLTIPFGVYLRKYFKLKLHWTMVFGLMLSLFYELTQYSGLYGIYPKAYRFTDVDDLIVNTTGAVLGYVMAGLIDKLLPDMSKDRSVATEKATMIRRAISLLVDYIGINIIYQLSRLVIYWNTSRREWDTTIFLASSAVIFILLPLVTRKKQTMGMLALRLYLVDKNGKHAKLSKALLHNLLAGSWLLMFIVIQGGVPGWTLGTILFEILFLIWLIILIIKSLLQKKICYYWEAWFDIYLKAYLPENRSEEVNKAGAA